MQMTETMAAPAGRSTSIAQDGETKGEAPARTKPGYLKTDARGKMYVDYKAVEDLRRLLTPNGRIYSRRRLGVTAREQRMLTQAIKRARYMAMLPYTSATL